MNKLIDYDLICKLDYLNMSFKNYCNSQDGCKQCQIGIHNKQAFKSSQSCERIFDLLVCIKRLKED
ncbi:hypothetical protein UT300012_32890 [Paraclostridium bifermentans]